MKVKDKAIFTTLRTEGAILPADLLQRIVENDKDLDGLKPTTYHLLEGEKLNESINRSWNRLRGAWVSFQTALEELSPNNLGTSVTRDRFLLPLFQELGYGRLTAAKALEVESRGYPISHGWLNTPIHLVGWRVDLDRRTAGVAGAARSSPHSLVQELLNRSSAHLWAFISNGRQLRILRDNVSLTRQAYVEFDLEAMMSGEVYSDFVLLWLLCHQSRVEAEKAEQCWLEKWSKTAQEQGTRALDQLRRGVEVAIATLGQGFLSHPANRELRQKLQLGGLSMQDYYRQLLRLVYRLLFLFVAEDRGFLLDPKADLAARERYTLYYSTARLRVLAEKRRGTRHADLFFGLRLVMEKLGSTEGCRELGLPALGSLLWSNEFVPDLMGVLPSSPSPFSPRDKGDKTFILPSPSGRGAGGEGQPCQITNADLLEAIRALAFINDKHSRRPVDYKNLRSEELGSVYEALLELHPELNVSAGTFALTTTAGNERKTTGSYYTPESLVQCLLDSALDPVVDEAVKKALTPRPPLPEGEGEKEEGGKWEIPVATRKKMQEVARQLRRQSTQSEAILWEALRNRRLEGRKFRRQHPIGTFVVDFFCQEEGLIVEIDGAVHESQQNLDRQRQELLESLCLRFVRVSSALVETDLSTALETIRQSFLPSSPSPFAPRAKGEKTSILPSPSGRGAGGEGINPAEQAILNLKVCDPACGSGHFLIAAAHRMAKRLATIRTGDEEPSPEATQKALRDVIGRCIYGVDINPMAVELCKVALWMESLEPGKPLSFLEHHIQCGNSLLGATPALLRKGIPDAAFTPIEGDDKAYCSKYKKQNKQEREKGQLTLLDERNQPWERLGDLVTGLVNLNQIADDDIAGVQQKQAQYEVFVKSTPYLFSRFWADAWCAAFVWKKCPPHFPISFPTGGEGDEGNANGDPSSPNPFSLREKGDKTSMPPSPSGRGAGGEGLLYPITDEVFRQIERNPYNAPDWMRREVERLRDRYKFFHWHLAFPDVFQVSNDSEDDQTGWNNGFDSILGNPPWDKVELLEREWFSVRRPGIANARTGAIRKQLIQRLATEDPSLYAAYLDALRQVDGERHFIRDSGRYPFCGLGRVNTYATFTETSRLILNLNGRLGYIVPSGIATDDSNKIFIQKVVQSQELVSFYDFTNRGYIFSETESTFCFSLLTFSSARNASVSLAAQLWSTEELKDSKKIYHLNSQEIRDINPNTLNLPIFKNKKDSTIIKEIYDRTSVFVQEEPNINLWRISFRQGLFNMTTDSSLFRTKSQLQTENWILDKNIFRRDSHIYLPLYEAKLVHMFNHRAATFAGTSENKMYGTRAATEKPQAENLSDPTWTFIPRYWVSQESVENAIPTSWKFSWLIGFRNAISAVADTRSVVFTVIPKFGIGNSLPLIFSQRESRQICLLVGNFNSFILDYVAKQKASGGNLNFYIVKQLPILSLEMYSEDISKFISDCILELTYTAWDLQPFAQDCGYNGPPFRWEDDRRFLLRCELDAAYFHLYDIDRDDVDYIMETFPIVKRKDEKAYGHYRTKDQILEIYDAMAEAMKEGRSYQTLLDPPPADPRVAHPPHSDRTILTYRG
jgi:very-short-patch-repair endonuclease